MDKKNIERKFIAMNVAEKIQQLRKREGLSQERLAEIIGVSRQAVSKWELGDSLPDMDKILALSECFGVSTDYLLKEGRAEEKENTYFDTKSTGETVNAPDYQSYKGYSYEYRSKHTLFGLPLVHIKLGREQYGRGRGRNCHAKGIIAIGNTATGVISIGGASVGLISLGGLSAGGLAVGGAAAGAAAVGGAAVGILAIGGLAVGVLAVGGVAAGYYAAGGCAIAKNVAYGDYARGYIAIGNRPHGTIEFLRKQLGSADDIENVRNAITTAFPNTWKWVVDLFTFISGTSF